MKLRHLNLFLFKFFLLVSFSGTKTHAQETKLDLSGTWALHLESSDEQISDEPNHLDFKASIDLPNTTAKAEKGKAATITPKLEDPWVRHFHQNYPFKGIAWFQKEVSIPNQWKDKDIILNLERVIWKSRIWVDGKEVSKPQLSLSTPHRYDLTKHLTPGRKSTISIGIDNRSKTNHYLGLISHSFTPETQSIWSGIIGDISLKAWPKVRISHVEVLPNTATQNLAIKVEITNHSKRKLGKQMLELSILNGSKSITKNVPIKTIPLGTSTHEISLSTKNADLTEWSEFSPKTYQFQVKVRNSIFKTVFGYRSFTRKGRQFLNNGSPVFLRGNLDCASFPATGHPDMSGEFWEKMFSTLNNWGFNHVRFHSWCPPKIAFETADRYGLYLQIELPNWTNHTGKFPQLNDYFKNEGRRILREYGNHPSFVMFCLGNELGGDFEWMDQFVAELSQARPDKLYTTTAFTFTARGLKPGAADDYFITQYTKDFWVRAQGSFNDQSPSTLPDYLKGINTIDIPLVSHEVGQYHTFPDLSMISKLKAANSPLRATAWEAVRDDLKSKGRLDLAERYTRDSVDFASKLYKQEIERALRTKDMGGIQLLQFHDFTGQGTATVGLVDAFWDNKGTSTADEFSDFNAPVVPLLRFERYVWQNDESFTASAEVANFGQGPIRGATPEWKLFDGDQLIKQGTLPARDIELGNAIKLGNISFHLKEITTAREMRLELHIGEYKNHWSLWVLPAETEPKPKNPNGEDSLLIQESFSSDTINSLKAGKNVLLLAPKEQIRKRRPGHFTPVFWSPVHFKNQPGLDGATILSSHPCFENFPTDSHLDWQWWELTHQSSAIDLGELRSINPNTDIPFLFIDAFTRNGLPTAIFECRVGKGKLLVCTFDLSSNLDKRPVANQLRTSLVNYARSSKFSPKSELSESELKSILKQKSFKVSSSSANSKYPASAAADENPSSFWHSEWENQNTLPQSLNFDFYNPVEIVGFSYTPRQDMDRGRISRYRLEASDNGSEWRMLIADQAFEAGAATQSIKLKEATSARYFRFTALEEQAGENFAACAELRPVFAEAAKAEELGIVPGFNDKEIR